MRKWVWVMFPFWFYGCFDYGYPAGGRAEPNVVAQWLFDEPSGDIVDEVSGLTLTAVPSGTGATYGVVAPAKYIKLSPGIRFWDSGLASGAQFESTTHGTALDLDLNDFVFEGWVSFDADPGVDKVAVLFGAYQVPPLTAYLAYIDFSTMALFFGIQSGATTVTASGTIPEIRGDGKLHKIRAAGDRGGNLVLSFDKSVLDTQSLAPLAALSIGAATYAVVGQELVGSLYELRLTVGNATNNSTPVWYP